MEDGEPSGLIAGMFLQGWLEFINDFYWRNNVPPFGIVLEAIFLQKADVLHPMEASSGNDMGLVLSYSDSHHTHCCQLIWSCNRLACVRNFIKQKKLDNALM